MARYSIAINATSKRYSRRTPWTADTAASAAGGGFVRRRACACPCARCDVSKAHEYGWLLLRSGSVRGERATDAGDVLPLFEVPEVARARRSIHGGGP